MRARVSDPASTVRSQDEDTGSFDAECQQRTKKETKYYNDHEGA